MGLDARGHRAPLRCSSCGTSLCCIECRSEVPDLELVTLQLVEEIIKVTLNFLLPLALSLS